MGEKYVHVTKVRSRSGASQVGPHDLDGTPSSASRHKQVAHRGDGDLRRPILSLTALRRPSSSLLTPLPSPA